MKAKQVIYTTCLKTPLRVNGSGESYRLSLAQRVVTGPTAVLDRQVTLIMGQEEAAEVALEIMGKVPLDALQKHLADLQKLVKVLVAAMDIEGRKS